MALLGKSNRILRALRWAAHAILFCSNPCFADSAHQVVRLGDRIVEGSVSNGASFYPAIPYARPPVGVWRWKATQPSPPEVPQRKAAVSCPQTVGDGIDGVIPPSAEDCLYLNVWAPVAHARPLPVVVFFHGGGLIAGSGLRDLYDGSSMARNGVVFVSFNYRLGPFGFLHSESETESMSRGFLDQAAALSWVSANIARFGGDPENVTLLGHSMGADSIRRLVNAGRVPAGIKNVILLSPGGDLGNRKGNISTAWQAQLASLPWKAVLRELKQDRLSEEPDLKDQFGAWSGKHLLLTVLYEEQVGESSRYHKKLCKELRLVSGLDERSQAYLYVLHSTSAQHGAELVDLFKRSPFGRAFEGLILSMAKTGKPPRLWGLWPIPWLNPSRPVAFHLLPWAQYPWLAPDCEGAER